MRKETLKLVVGLSLAISLVSCDKEDDAPSQDVGNEFKYVRILVNDESSTELSLVNPVTQTVEKFNASHSKSALYGTEAGRYGALVNGAGNHVEFFDTGFENHGDHVDVKGTPKFATITGNGKTPVHFKSKGDEVIVFNDGDGSLSIGTESNFHTSGAVLTKIDAGNQPHHGAMTKFNNGTYAITVKDGSVAGTLPERVKIINTSGQTLFPSTIQTSGIHGNATNGAVSLFGSSSGILVVEPSGNQRLIPHPADFGTAWFGTILEAKGVGKFIGYTAAKGAYAIDVNSGTITPILASTDIMQIKTDFPGTHLIVLLHSGEVKIYDLATNTFVSSAVILPVTAKEETQKPQLEATQRFLYITQPKSGELLQLDRKNFSKINRIKVTATPYRLAILGIESNESH